jgi:hypothetical protein
VRVEPPPLIVVTTGENDIVDCELIGEGAQTRVHGGSQATVGVGCKYIVFPTYTTSDPSSSLVPEPSSEPISDPTLARTSHALISLTKPLGRIVRANHPYMFA